MMFELFKWGFVLSMALTWLALGVGVVMLLMPTSGRERRLAEVPHARAA